MKTKRKIMEQAEEATTPNIDMKQAVGLDCFSEYEWFTIDDKQPRKTKSGLDVVTGTNAAGDIIWFYNNGVVKNLNTNKTATWSCSKIKGGVETPAMDEEQLAVIKRMLELDKSLTDKKPSQVDIENKSYQQIDLHTKYPAVFKEANKFFVWKKTGVASTYTEQQTNIFKALVNNGYTNIEPDVTTAEHDKVYDVRTILNGKYSQYFKEYTPVWYVGVERAKQLMPSTSGTTTGDTSVTTTGDATPQNAKKVVDNIKTNLRNNKISRTDCIAAIKYLYAADRNPGTQYFENDSDILALKNTAKKCSTQGTNFVKGALGVGDELEYLESKKGKYGLMENKKIDLKNIIKENLVKTQESKKRVLQENKIIENRFNIILEGKKLKSQKEIDNLYVTILSEMIYLHKQGFDGNLIEENVDKVFGTLGNLFGLGINGVMATFKEKGVNYILEKLGIEDNSFLRNFLMTAMGNVDLKDVPKLFSDCDFLTRKIAESIPEAYLRELEYEKGMGSEFMDVVRNSLYDVIKNSDLADKIEGRISSIVCPLVERMSGKFSDHLDSMKSSLISVPSNIQA